ncbi:MAG: hypothetical protein AAGD05_15440 [Bacteroidota bacterium]
MKERIRGYFGGGDGNELIILNTANRLMEDERQVDQLYQEMIADRLFEAIIGVVTIQEKAVSAEELEAELQKAREAMMAENLANQVTANETSEEEGTTDESTAEEVTEDVEQ